MIETKGEKNKFWPLFRRAAGLAVHWPARSNIWCVDCCCCWYEGRTVSPYERQTVVPYDPRIVSEIDT
jgi:hypothetical protein